MRDIRKKLRVAVFKAASADRDGQETFETLVDAALGVLDEEIGHYAEELRVARARVEIAEKERDEARASAEHALEQADALFEALSYSRR